MNRTKSFKLPKGAILFKNPLTKKTGIWNELTFDAKVERYGITWLRVMGGFGSRSQAGWHFRPTTAWPQEDWIADLPGICISVHDYNWDKGNFGTKYNCFNDAVIGETRGALDCAMESKKELLKTMATLNSGIEIIKDFLYYSERKENNYD